MHLFRFPVLRPIQASALVIILAAALSGCSRSQTAEAGSAGEQAMPITVVSVQRDSVRRAVDVVGTLTAVDQVTIVRAQTVAKRGEGRERA